MVLERAALSRLVTPLFTVYLGTRYTSKYRYSIHTRELALTRLKPTTPSLRIDAELQAHEGFAVRFGATGTFLLLITNNRGYHSTSYPRRLKFSRRTTYASSFLWLLPSAAEYCMLAPLRSIWEAVAGTRGWIHTVDGMEDGRKVGLPRKHALSQKQKITIST